MSCLGERLTALVDGELGHEERDRALAHLACCARCRSEADMLRRIKGRLRGLGDLPPADGADDLPSEDFLTKLRAMGDPDQPQAADPQGDDEVAAQLRSLSDPDETPAPSDEFLGRLRSMDGPPGEPVRPEDFPRSWRVPGAASRPRDNRPAARARVPSRGLSRTPAGAAAVALPRRRYLAVAGAGLVIGLGAASYAAGGPQDTPAVRPAFDRFAVEHSLTSGDAPVTEPLDTRPGTVPSTPGP